ncbi:MAG: HlyD family efflux transporter periplasmic adaptor subunit [Verrucomicrobiota bacterium]|nr:HlyD family efflux transporter periplasmic adaptor subunit [Verrucomicrobiota bacterium]
MDVVRQDIAAKKRRKRILWTVTAVVIVVGGFLGLKLVKPAAPTVERSTVWIDTVKKGTLAVRVRGVGTLTPEDQRWITARTAGRVEKLVILPGAKLEPGTLILELSNPELDQQNRNAALQLTAAESEYANLEAELQGRVLELQSTIAGVEADYKSAKLEAEVNEALYKEGLVAELTLKQSRLQAERLEAQLAIEKRRLASQENAVIKQLAAREVNVQQERERFNLVKGQVEQLKVRAVDRGILQRLPVVEGEQVTAGQNLAQVANPTRLKAVVRVPETQAKDVQIGQQALIDTRNGTITGEVMRVDPTVENGTVNVDVRLTAELPRGARPDLTIEGSIDLESLADVLYVGRPAFAREHGSVSIFRLSGSSNLAERTSVTFGRSSVTEIEVKSGLSVGDRVILSDTTQWDRFERIQVK